MALVRARRKANKGDIFQIIIYAADLWNSFLDKVVGSGSLEELVFIEAFKFRSGVPFWSEPTDPSLICLTSPHRMVSQCTNWISFSRNKTTLAKYTKYLEHAWPDICYFSLTITYNHVGNSLLNYKLILGWWQFGSQTINPSFPISVGYHNKVRHNLCGHKTASVKLRDKDNGDPVLAECWPKHQDTAEEHFSSRALWSVRGLVGGVSFAFNSSSSMLENTAGQQIKEWTSQCHLVCQEMLYCYTPCLCEG